MSDLFKTYAQMANPGLAATSGMAGAPVTNVAPLPPGPQTVGGPQMHTMGQPQQGGQGDDRYMQRWDMTRGQFHDLRDQFKDDRQEWRQDGRLGPRPVWRNYLMPDGAPGGGMNTMPVQPQPLPVPPAPQAIAPYGGVGTGLGVQGATMPTNPFAIPGYGG